MCPRFDGVSIGISRLARFAPQSERGAASTRVFVTHQATRLDDVPNECEMNIAYLLGAQRFSELPLH